MARQQKDLAGDGPNVLFISAESAARGLILVFLSIMSCRCVVVVSEAELEVLDRETFDAVLIDWVLSNLPVEKAIARLCPTFSDRILILRGRATHPRMIELAYRYRLQQISDELWPQQLWPALQEIFATTRASQDVPPDVEIAQLIFDSASSGAPAGIRNVERAIRQLVYKHYRTTIDVFLERREKSGRFRVAGQVLHDSALRRGGIPVKLVDPTRTVAHTSTNEFGEFDFDSEALNNVSLELRLHEALWVSLPIGRLGRLETANRSATRDSPQDEDDPPTANQTKKQCNGE